MTPELQTLIEKALNAWPRLAYAGNRSSRAHAAAELVERGKVRHLGGDVYDVDGRHVGADSDTCDCEDHEQGRAPEYPRIGRLCKHRVAARMYRVWGGERNERLLDLIRTATEGNLWARLIVEWDYTTDRRSVVGTETPQGRNRRPGSEGVEFTWIQLRWALEQVGWGLVRLPEKAKRYEYIYRLAPGRGIEVSESTMHVQGVTEPMAQRHEYDQWFADEVARNGNQVGVELSTKTAQAVSRRRAELAAA